MTASNDNTRKKADLKSVTTRTRPNRMELVRTQSIDNPLPRSGLVTLSVERVHDNPVNERKTFANIEGLMESIRDKGIIEPPSAIPHPSIPGHVQLVTGSRRLRAAKGLGHEQITVNLAPAEADDELRIKSLISNIQREDVPAVEMAEALKALLRDSETVKTQRELARRLGKDETWVSGMLRILSMGEALREEISSAERPVPYESAIRIARVNNPEKQAELVDAAVQGATHREIRERIASIAEPRRKRPARGADGEADGVRSPRAYTVKLKEATVSIRFKHKRRIIPKEERIAILEQALEIERGKGF